MTRDEWVVLPLKDSDEVSIVIRRSEVVAYGPTNGGFTWVTMAGSDNTYTAHMPLAEFEALLFAPAPAAPDDYTRAGMAWAEAEALLVAAPLNGRRLMDAKKARRDLQDAFLRLYRERRGG